MIFDYQPGSVLLVDDSTGNIQLRGPQKFAVENHLLPKLIFHWKLFHRSSLHLALKSTCDKSMCWQKRCSSRPPVCCSCYRYLRERRFGRNLCPQPCSACLFKDHCLSKSCSDHLHWSEHNDSLWFHVNDYMMILRSYIYCLWIFRGKLVMVCQEPPFFVIRSTLFREVG